MHPLLSNQAETGMGNVVHFDRSVYHVPNNVISEEAIAGLMPQEIKTELEENYMFLSSRPSAKIFGIIKDQYYRNTNATSAQLQRGSIIRALTLNNAEEIDRDEYAVVLGICYKSTDRNKNYIAALRVDFDTDSGGVSFDGNADRAIYYIELDGNPQKSDRQLGPHVEYVFPQP